MLCDQAIEWWEPKEPVTHRPSKQPIGLPVPVVLLSKKVSFPDYTPPPLQPFECVEQYINLTHPADPELIRRLYTKPVDTTVKPPPIIPENVPSDPLHVFINKKGVRTVPMAPVIKALSKGKKAPLEVRIKAASGFGYSDSILMKMIAHDDKVKKQSDKMDQFIDSIFGRFVNSKTSKPKAKTNKEIINTILKKKPLKK